VVAGTVGVVVVLVLGAVVAKRDGTHRTPVGAPRGATTLPASGRGPSEPRGTRVGAVDPARPFAATSPWNTPAPATTRWFDTPRLHRLVAASSNGDRFRHWWVSTSAVGIWWASPNDPVWTFDLPAYVAPAFHRNRAAARFTMRAPAALAAGTDEDHVLVVMDGATGDYVEVWQADVDARTRTVRNRAGQVGWARGNAATGPGAGTLAENDGVRASNFSWAAGLITGADLAAREIDHALVVALPSEVLMGGGNTGHQGGVSTSTPAAWRAPATAWDAGFWPGPIEMGSRIGIPAGVRPPSGLSPVGTMVFRALQTYGAFVGDYTGGQWPMFYADGRTVTTREVCPLFCSWEHGGSSDMEKIAPLLRVADYRPSES
jgi:hypothetical protein